MGTIEENKDDDMDVTINPDEISVNAKDVKISVSEIDYSND